MLGAYAFDAAAVPKAAREKVGPRLWALIAPPTEVQAKEEREEEMLHV